LSVLVCALSALWTFAPIPLLAAFNAISLLIVLQWKPSNNEIWDWFFPASK
jgi:hypothetical protein